MPAIEVIYDANNQLWFKRADVGDFIGISNMRDTTHNISKTDKKSRDEITVGLTDGSYKPSKHAKPHDGFLSVNGVTTVIMNSRKPNARKVAAWIIKDIIPRGFSKMIKELTKNHQQAIEVKDSALALLNDDLEERDSKIQAIKYENVGLQGEIKAKDTIIKDLVEKRHVPRCGVYDNILITVDKNVCNEDGKKGRHKYYMIRCQKEHQDTQLSRINVKYRNMVIKGSCEDPNAIHQWRWFREVVLDDDDYYRNHFSLNDNQKDEFEKLFNIKI